MNPAGAPAAILIQDANEYVQREMKNRNQLDATYYFIVLFIGSTCFGHYYAHHQELATMLLITTLVVSFCKDGERGGGV